MACQSISLQRSLPFQSAVTISYVGSSSPNLVTWDWVNVARPGRYTNLQAARPFPAFGDIYLYNNVSSSGYHAGHLKWEKRLSHGLSSSLAYAFSKNIADGNGSSLTDYPMPYAPAGYNRGRSALDRKHILNLNAVYELPLGRGRKFGGSMPRVANLLVGGWELTSLYSFSSGGPLSFLTPGATLGNSLNTRANLVGNPRVSNPNVLRWFDPAAFSAPAATIFGNSGIGLMDGPGSHVMSAGLLKNFSWTESRYVQFRWELFNPVNHVNYSNPNTSIGQATTGRITSAGDARSMQLALKFYF